MPEFVIPLRRYFILQKFSEEICNGLSSMKFNFGKMQHVLLNLINQDECLNQFKISISWHFNNISVLVNKLRGEITL